MNRRARCGLHREGERRYRPRVSEAREQDTDDREEVDLEALLEEFREPEPPRKARGNPLWLILALLMSILGFWLAARATGGHLGPGRGETVKMKPTKARDRGSYPPRFAGDVAEDFATRCRKGMSALEVRWVLEDFHGAGLDEGPGSLTDEITALAGSFPEWKPLSGGAADKLEVLLERLAARQRSWYCGTLADALRLDRDQVAEARGKLARIHETEKPEPPPHPGEGAVPGPRFHGSLQAAEWLADERNAPWNLCALSKEQLAVTRHEEVVREQLNVISSEPGGKGAVPSWFDLRPRTDESAPPELERARQDAAALFPFVSGQDAEGGGELLALAKGLHPAQLKTLLLLEPAIAGSLMEELEAQGE